MTQKIGRRIRSERQRLKLKQFELAAKLGVSFQAVSNWENNRTKPSTTSIQKMGELGFDVPFIFTGLTGCLTN